MSWVCSNTHPPHLSCTVEEGVPCIPHSILKGGWDAIQHLLAPSSNLMWITVAEGASCIPPARVEGSVGYEPSDTSHPALLYRRGRCCSHPTCKSRRKVGMQAKTTSNPPLLCCRGGCYLHPAFGIQRESLDASQHPLAPSSTLL